MTDDPYNPHMAGNPPTPPRPENERVNDLYSASVIEGQDFGGDTHTVKDLFRKGFSDLWRRGLIVTDSETVHMEAHWHRVSGLSTTNTGQLLDDFVNGVVPLMPELWLEGWVTVGKEKRIMVQHMISSDWDIIIGIRVGHRDDATAAIRKARTAKVKFDDAVATHGSITAAVRSGTFLRFAPPTGGAL